MRSFLISLIALLAMMITATEGWCDSPCRERSLSCEGYNDQCSSAPLCSANEDMTDRRVRLATPSGDLYTFQTDCCCPKPTQSPSMAPTCFENERVLPGTCGARCLFPYAGPGRGDEACSECRCEKDGTCGTNDSLFECNCRHGTEGDLCERCSDGFDSSTDCMTCEMGKAGEDCSEDTQCVHGTPRVDFSPECEQGSCHEMWPTSNLVAASMWKWEGAKCNRRAMAPEELVEHCDILVDQTRYAETLSANNRNEHPTACHAFIFGRQGVTVERAIDDLQVNLVACAEAFVQIPNVHPSGLRATSFVKRCLYDQAVAQVQGTSRIRVNKCVTNITTSGQYLDSDKEAVGLDGAPGKLGSIIENQTDLLRNANGHFDLAKACRVLCQCGKYTDFDRNDAQFCTESATSANLAIELHRIHAGYCPAWVDENQPGMIVKSTHLAKALFCLRDEMIKMSLQSDNPDADLKMALYASFDEVATAAADVLAGQDDVAPPDLSDDYVLAEKVLRAHQEILTLDRREARDPGSGPTAIGTMPLFSVQTLNSESMAESLRIADQLERVADNLALMETNAFAFNGLFQAGSSLVELMGEQTAAIAFAFDTQFLEHLRSLEADTNSLVESMAQTEAILVDSFERFLRMAGKLPSDMEKLQLLYEDALETAGELIRELNALAHARFIFDVVIGIVMTGITEYGAVMISKAESSAGKVKYYLSSLGNTAIGNIYDRIAQTVIDYSEFDSIQNRSEDGYTPDDPDVEGEIPSLSSLLDSVMESTLARFDDSLRLFGQLETIITDSTFSNETEGDFLENQITPPTSSAVWMEIYREIMYLARYEWNLCPRPAMDGAFDDLLESRRRALELRASHGHNNSSAPTKLRKSLASKARIAELRAELEGLAEDIEAGCVQLENDLLTWAENGALFQQTLDTYVHQIYGFIALTGKMETLQASRQKVDNNFQAAAETENPWGDEAVKAAQFTEMYKTQIGMDVIMLEHQARSAIKDLCEAYRYANPQIISGGDQFLDVTGVEIDRNTCEVRLLTTALSLHTRVEVLSRAVTELSTMWRRDFLEDFASTPSLVTSDYCSIVHPNFFVSLEDTASATFEVNLDAFKSLCSVNTEMLRMHIVFVDDEWNVLPKPGETDTPVQALVESVPGITFSKVTETTTPRPDGNPFDPPQDFSSTRTFSFQTRYRVPEQVDGPPSCGPSETGFTIGPLDKRVQICGSFEQVSDSLSELFVRPTPYSMWKLTIFGGQGLIQGATRAIVQFDLVTNLPRNPRQACDGETGGILTPPNPNGRERNVLGGSVGSSCQWKQISGYEISDESELNRMQQMASRMDGLMISSDDETRRGYGGCHSKNRDIVSDLWCNNAAQCDSDLCAPTTCRSIAMNVTDRWCMKTNCFVGYSDVCEQVIGGIPPPDVAPTPLPTARPPSNCILWWDQCDGLGFQGPDCCEAGSTCTKSEQTAVWYSFCKPDENMDEDGCAPPWGQCGGPSEDYSGSNCCIQGSTCVVQSEWYSQCVPDSYLP